MPIEANHEISPQSTCIPGPLSGSRRRPSTVEYSTYSYCYNHKFTTTVSAFGVTGMHVHQGSKVLARPLGGGSGRGAKCAVVLYGTDGRVQTANCNGKRQKLPKAVRAAKDNRSLSQSNPNLGQKSRRAKQSAAKQLRSLSSQKHSLSSSSSSLFLSSARCLIFYPFSLFPPCLFPPRPQYLLSLLPPPPPIKHITVVSPPDCQLAAHDEDNMEGHCAGADVD